MRYYADSCIWIDFLEDRYPVNLFEDCLKHKEELLISDILLDELSRYILVENMRMMLQILESEKLLYKTISTIEQKFEAKNIATQRQIPIGDALHAIIARDYNATLVTRDKHFLRLTDICKVELQ